MNVRMARAVVLSLTLAALIAISACAPISPQTQAPAHQVVATLRIAGPHVVINGRPAVDGEPYHDGDQLATGQGSSARLEFSDGGIVQLNENTDFSVERVTQAVACMFRVLFHTGDTHVVDGSSCRFQPQVPQLEGETGSDLIVHSTARSATVTLFYGSFRLLRPVRTTLRPAEQITVADGAVIGRRFLTQDELRDVRRWVETYRFSLLTAVPAVGGLALDAAHQRLKQAGLQLGRVHSRPDRRYRPGTVVEQTPQAGARVRAGTAVSVVVASEPPVVVVPNLAGVDLRTAQGQLQRYNLAPGRVAEVVNPQYRPGLVVGSSPPPGQHVAAGTRVDLYVAKQELMRVPSLVRLNLDQARQALGSARLQLGNTYTRPTNTAPSGTIVSQSPPAGQMLPPGSRVDVYVAQAALVSVPNVSRQSVENARRILKNVGLGLKVVETRVVGGGYKPGEIFDQYPRPGATVRPGDAISVRVQGTLR